MSAPDTQFAVLLYPNGLPLNGAVIETTLGPIAIGAQTSPIAMNSTGFSAPGTLGITASQISFFDNTGVEDVRFDYANGQYQFLTGQGGANGHFVIAGGTSQSLTSGIFHFDPSTSGRNQQVTFQFLGGTHEIFAISNTVLAGGTVASRWVIGPDPLDNQSNIQFQTGKGIGLGIDPGAGSVVGQVVLMDGGKITAAANTTGITFGAAGDKLGFYAAAPQAKLTVTGAKGGNAAITSLCAQLAVLGLIVDGTS